MKRIVTLAAILVQLAAGTAGAADRDFEALMRSCGGQTPVHGPNGLSCPGAGGSGATGVNPYAGVVDGLLGYIWQLEAASKAKRDQRRASEAQQRAIEDQEAQERERRRLIALDVLREHQDQAQRNQDSVRTQQLAAVHQRLARSDLRFKLPARPAQAPLQFKTARPTTYAAATPPTFARSEDQELAEAFARLPQAEQRAILNEAARRSGSGAGLQLALKSTPLPGGDTPEGLKDSAETSFAALQRRGLITPGRQGGSSPANLQAPAATPAPCPGTSDASVVDLRCASTTVVAPLRAEAARRDAAAAAPPPPPPAEAQRTYQPSGNGLIGGTTWQMAYNVPPAATPEVVEAARARMKENAARAGEKSPDYDAVIDYDRYNFAVGLAVSSQSTFKDLRARVLLDQLRNGQASTELQNAYAPLKNRSFGELGCHSNGAMICLAALENRDVQAERVVLYGPQITEESLEMWQGLIAAGRVQSVEVMINDHDPVPALSLAAGTGPTPLESARNAATAVAVGYVTNSSGMKKAINATAPGIRVISFACDAYRLSAVGCHDMRLYKENRRRLDAAK